MSTQDGAFEGVVKYDLLAKTVVEVYTYIHVCYMLRTICYIVCIIHITSIIVAVCFTFIVYYTIYATDY